MISALLTAVAFALYLASAVCYGATLFLSASAAPSALGEAPTSLWPSRLARPLLLIGIVVQFASIGAWCVRTHHSPFAGEYGALAVTAWAIALAFALLDLRFRLPAVGAIALLVACVVLGFGGIHARGPIAEDPRLEQQITSIHVLAIVASFGLLAVAFGCAALYLLQNRLLKQHSVTPRFRRLPPLTTLDTVAYQCVAYALPLLTLGLAVGMVIAFSGATHKTTLQWLLDSHFLVSIVLWLLYVLYLTARLAVGWRGVRLQYILLIGLLVAFALYVLPPTAHRFN